LDAKSLGERIRKARERKQLSQGELASLISRDQRAVSEYELGKRRIFVTELPRLAEVLDVPLLYFLEDELGALEKELFETFYLLPDLDARQAAVELLKLFSTQLQRRTPP
jgi:transcriptional regulator with XRE-family HTH domain